MFGFVWTKRRLKIAFWILVVAVVVGSIAGFFNWVAIDQWLKRHEQILKLIGYVIAPLFAILSFVSSQLDKIELREQQDESSRLRERATVAEAKAKEARDEAAEKSEEAQQRLSELKAITVGAEQLWKVRPPQPFEKYNEWWVDRPGAVVATIGNLKGGVGKTTIAANFAAYLSERRQKRVLIIDLDYQGSLSGLMLTPLNLSGGPRVNALFEPDADVADVLRSRIQLVPTDPLISTRLSRAWLVPSDYEYGTLENRLLLRLLLNQTGQVDSRYLLAHTLLNPDVRRDYDVILFDMPPRLTIGSINALVASHYFFVPTMLDMLSIEAVPQFLKNVMGLKSDMDLKLDLAGIIGMMTRVEKLDENEKKSWSRAEEAGRLWNKDRDFRFEATIPRRKAVSDAVGEAIAYLSSDPQSRATVRQVFDPLFDDMAARIGLS